MLILFAAVTFLLSGCDGAEGPENPQLGAEAGSVETSGGETSGAEAGPAEPVSDTGASPENAVLHSGPDPQRGILVLQANAIRHYQGVYVHDGVKLTVRYSEEHIVIPSGWVTRRCGTLPVSFTVENGTLHYVYQAEEQWYVFFEIPESYGRDCAFIERFLQRFRYFRSVTGSGNVPFPAVLEIG